MSQKILSRTYRDEKYAFEFIITDMVIGAACTSEIPLNKKRIYPNSPIKDTYIEITKSGKCNKFARGTKKFLLDTRTQNRIKLAQNATASQKNTFNIVQILSKYIPTKNVTKDTSFYEMRKWTIRVNYTAITLELDYCAKCGILSYGDTQIILTPTETSKLVAAFEKRYHNPNNKPKEKSETVDKELVKAFDIFALLHLRRFK